MTSLCVWNSIIGLSETSYNLNNPRSVLQRQIAQPDTDMLADITQIALLAVLEQVRDWVSDVSAAWTSRIPCDQKLLSAVSSHAVGRDLNSAIYWLFIRLGMLALITRIMVH